MPAPSRALTGTACTEGSRKYSSAATEATCLLAPQRQTLQPRLRNTDSPASHPCMSHRALPEPVNLHTSVEAEAAPAHALSSLNHSTEPPSRMAAEQTLACPFSQTEVMPVIATSTGRMQVLVPPVTTVDTTTYRGLPGGSAPLSHCPLRSGHRGDSLWLPMNPITFPQTQNVQ